jgi:conjugal transfer pilus assembly protein TraF
MAYKHFKEKCLCGQILIIAIFIFFAQPLFAEFHEYDHYRGWFFHNEKYPQEEETPKPKKEVITPSPSVQTPKAESQKKVLSATEQVGVFRDSLEEAKNRAILNPTPENMQAWLYQQRAMWNQTDLFSKVFKEVVFSDQKLGSARNHPTSNYAINAFAQEKHMAYMKITERLSDIGQMFFFFDESPHSKAQVNPLKILQEKYHIAFFSISIDGGEIEGIENYRVDNGISKKIGVTKYPSLYFVVPKTNQLFFISEGAISTDSMVERLIVVAKRANLVPEEMIPSGFNTNPDNTFDSVNDYIRRNEDDSF